MTALRDLSGSELAEMIRKQAEDARENDERFGLALGDLLKTVEELATRVDDDE